MKIKVYFLIVAGILVVSCSNDSDFFPSFNDKCDWETSLGEILNDNMIMFDNQDIEVTDVKFLKDFKIDRNIFYNSQYGYFPVYSKKDSVFEVIKYDDMDKKAGEYGFNTKVVNDKIEEILEKADDYDVIQLTWRYGSDSFKSLSLFNKKTGELEYDNMLFNMSTISKYSGHSFGMFIRGAENAFGEEEYSYSDSTVIPYYEDYNLMASIKIDWTATGVFAAHTSMTGQNDTTIRYMVDYTFRFNTVDFRRTNFVSDPEIYTTDFQNRILTPQLSPNYEFIYALWAGRKSAYINDHDHPYTLTNEGFDYLAQFNPREGRGDVVHVYKAPTKPSYSYIVHK